MKIHCTVDYPSVVHLGPSKMFASSKSPSHQPLWSFRTLFTSQPPQTHSKTLCDGVYMPEGADWSSSCIQMEAGYATKPFRQIPRQKRIHSKIVSFQHNQWWQFWEEHPPMRTGIVTRMDADHQTRSIIFMGNVSRAMYPSKLMQSVIVILYGVLNNNYWLVLNVLNVPNSTVAKRTMLKETSNK